jgi:uncharacterized OB-fold protein
VKAAEVRDGIHPRALPVIDEDGWFWTSGQDGLLRFMRCMDCGYYMHPPGPVCARCLSRTLNPQPVSGEGLVASFTVNHQQWSPIPPPYVVAIVSLGDQEDLRLTSNIVDCEPDTVTIGLAVRLAFERYGGLYIPVFTPAAPARTGPEAEGLNP